MSQHAIKKSNAITLEAWVTPADTVQSGPARIITLSNGIGSRNFTLGQSGDHFETRLRTTRTSDNGEPSLASTRGSAVIAPLHVVYTRNSSGDAVVYVNGQESGQRKVEGDFSKWDGKFHLALGNELSGDRLWQGTLHLAAVYDRALSLRDVRRNHAAGGAVVEDKERRHLPRPDDRHCDKRSGAYDAHGNRVALYRMKQTIN